MSYEYDLLVIGAGSGGLAAAKRAASYGARVAIVEQQEVVVRGCVPKKFLVYASHFPEQIKGAKGYGWEGLPQPSLNWHKLRDTIQAEVQRLSTLHVSLLEKAGVVLLQGHASFEDEHTVSIKAPTGRSVTADKILIATGGRPSYPQLEGIQHALCSDDMFLLPELPKRLIVAGGGYIGVEFASMMSGLGCEVTVVIRKEQILRGFDDEVCTLLQAALVKRGVKFVVGRSYKSLSKEGDTTVVTLDDDTKVEGDSVVLFATGRTPNVENLCLEKAGVSRSGQAIEVDGNYGTSQSNIFAVGDCTDRINLTPVAIAEGRAFADREYGGKNSTVSYNVIPTAVFSTPEVGVVGMTEAEAKSQYGDSGVKIYKTSFKPMYEALAGGEERVFMKILVHRDSNRVLGVHVIGSSAAEMIQCVGIALQAGATKDDFDATMALHPSSAEELVTLYTPSN
jgi:glutathione reductase (NADPH)